MNMPDSWCNCKTVRLSVADSERAFTRRGKGRSAVRAQDTVSPLHPRRGSPSLGRFSQKIRRGGGGDVVVAEVVFVPLRDTNERVLLLHVVK